MAPQFIESSLIRGVIDVIAKQILLILKSNRRSTLHSHLAKMLGQYILEKRNKLGILQKELAEETGISAQFLGRIERGDVMVPEPVLLKCISYLSLNEKKMVQIYRAAAGLSAQSLFTQAKKTRKSKRA